MGFKGKSFDNLGSGSFFGKQGKRKKERLIHLLHELSAALHCLPVISDVIFCHAINVSQSDFTGNSCDRLEVRKWQSAMYIPCKRNSVLRCLLITFRDKTLIEQIGVTSESFLLGVSEKCGNKQVRFWPFWSEINRVCLSLWLGIGYSVYKELSFPHQHWQNCNPSQMFTQMEGNSNLIIAAIIHILELCTDFKEMKWGIDFLLR